MQWTREANLKATVTALEVASAEGAQIRIFPEQSITGFHRNIVAFARPEIISLALRQVEQACQRLGVATAVGAVVGAPTLDKSGTPLNS